jgi:probable rRNA maturation factor
MRTAAAIAVIVECASWREALPGAAALACKAARAALAGARRDGAAVPAALELSLVLADDALLRRLNRDFRHRDKPTNVLSFPALSVTELARAAEGAGTTSRVPLGDVVLALETMRAEAQVQGKTLAGHFAHLVVHGTLHLLGYDHLKAAEASRMEGLEVAVLERLGVADPYAAPARAGRAGVVVHG